MFSSEVKDGVITKQERSYRSQFHASVEISEPCGLNNTHVLVFNSI